MEIPEHPCCYTVGVISAVDRSRVQPKQPSRMVESWLKYAGDYGEKVPEEMQQAGWGGDEGKLLGMKHVHSLHRQADLSIQSFTTYRDIKFHVLDMRVVVPAAERADAKHFKREKILRLLSVCDLVIYDDEEMCEWVRQDKQPAPASADGILKALYPLFQTWGTELAIPLLGHRMTPNIDPSKAALLKHYFHYLQPSFGQGEKGPLKIVDTSIDWMAQWMWKLVVEAAAERTKRLSTLLLTDTKEASRQQTPPPEKKEENQAIHQMSLKLIKFQRFDKLHVTHAKVLQGTFRLGDSVADSGNIGSTAHPSNVVVSMRSYPDNTVLKEAYPGMHVCFQTDCDLELLRLEKQKITDETEKLVKSRSLAEAIPGTLLTGANSIQEVTGVPLLVAAVLSTEELRASLNTQIAVGQGVFLDGYGGRTLAYVMDIGRSSSQGFTRLTLLTDPWNNHAVALQASGLQVASTKPERDLAAPSKSAAGWLPPTHVALCMECGQGPLFLARVTSVVNTFGLHRKTVEAREMSSTDTARAQAEQKLACFLDGSAHFFSVFQTNPTHHDRLQRVRGQIMVEVTRELQNARHLVDKNFTREDVIRSPAKKKYTLLNMLPQVSMHLYTKGIECLFLDYKLKNFRHINRDFLVSCLAASCTEKKSLLDSAVNWLRTAQHDAKMNVTNGERLLMDALLEQGSAIKVVQMLQKSNGSLDKPMFDKILSSEVFPSYILFFTGLYSDQALYPRKLDSFSAQNKVMLSRWVGAAFAKSQQDKLLSQLNLKAVVMRYWLLHAFLSAPQLQQRGPLSFNAVNLIYEYLGYAPVSEATKPKALP